MPTQIDLEFGGLRALADVTRCPACGRHMRGDPVLGNPRKPVRRFPLSLSSDGYVVASREGRATLVNLGAEGVDFAPLGNGYAALVVHRRVAYDLSRLEYLVEEDHCPTCDTYRRHLVAGPRSLARGVRPVGDLEIVESRDLWGVEVGDGVAQHPDLIVGDVLAAALGGLGIRGVTLEPTI